MIFKLRQDCPHRQRSDRTLSPDLVIFCELLTAEADKWEYLVISLYFFEIFETFFEL